MENKQLKLIHFYFKCFRQLFATIGAIIIFPFTSDDVVYSYLPLYHSSGGQLATAGAFFNGTKTIIKKKFSASSFWKDIIKYDVTVNTLLTTNGTLSKLTI